jgi:hypothetical protein
VAAVEVSTALSAGYWRGRAVLQAMITVTEDLMSAEVLAASLLFQPCLLEPDLLPTDSRSFAVQNDHSAQKNSSDRTAYHLDDNLGSATSS